jgi:hypothetical protein
MKGLLKNIVGAVAPTLGSAMGGPSVRQYGYG